MKNNTTVKHVDLDEVKELEKRFLSLKEHL
jgi:hypothetical protein